MDYVIKRALKMLEYVLQTRGNRGTRKDLGTKTKPDNKTKAVQEEQSLEH